MLSQYSWFSRCLIGQRFGIWKEFFFLTRSIKNEAITEWVVDTAPRALAYAISLVRDVSVAEDLVQDCYQRLFAKTEQYNLERDGTRILFRSITNSCINWTSRKPPVSGLVVEPVEKKCRSPLELAIGNELAVAVDLALVELPVDQRAAIELSTLGHSSREIAEILEMTPGNVRVLLHRARSHLEEQLQEYLEN